MFPSKSVQRPLNAVSRTPYVNFAYGRVEVPPFPDMSGTVLTLKAGEAARFPPVPFSASVWPYASAPDPDTSEVVLVTAVSGDTMTFVRAQQNTVARAIVMGDSVSANVTAGAMNAIGFWEQVDLSLPLYGVADTADGDPQSGIWTGPTDPNSSYAFASVGIGTIHVAFYLSATTLTAPIGGSAVLALKLPTSAQFGQAYGHDHVLSSGRAWIRQDGVVLDPPTFMWVGYGDSSIRLTAGALNAGSYDVVGMMTVACDWW